ncbi:MAG: sulfatase-like hydrolase/transferase [Planctomycetota bacterium]
MKRRDFIKRVCLGAAAMTTGGMISCGADKKESKPNIVLILADDLGYGDIGCYGSQTVRTPNLDALAGGGMKFTDFHSNGPMCSPTRAALLTGRYQQRAGIEGVLGYVRARKIGMATTEVTFAEALKSAGYATGIFGKWHTGHLPEYGPIRQGFNTFRGLYGGLDYHSHVNRVGRENWWKNEELAPEEGYVTELITAHAERFIEQHEDRPFCLYVPHFAVHFPWQGPNDKADFLPGVNNASPQKKYGSRTDRKNAYREMIESLDDSVGRIVDKIRRLGLERKTLVFFTSDNGGHELVASSGPLAGYKGSLLEGGHRGHERDGNDNGPLSDNGCCDRRRVARGFETRWGQSVAVAAGAKEPSQTHTVLAP